METSRKARNALDELDKFMMFPSHDLKNRFNFQAIENISGKYYNWEEFLVMTVHWRRSTVQVLENNTHRIPKNFKQEIIKQWRPVRQQRPVKQQDQSNSKDQSNRKDQSGLVYIKLSQLDIISVSNSTSRSTWINLVNLVLQHSQCTIESAFTSKLTWHSAFNFHHFHLTEKLFWILYYTKWISAYATNAVWNLAKRDLHGNKYKRTIRISSKDKDDMTSMHKPLYNDYTWFVHWPHVTNNNIVR